jgi:hypothetical protein
LSPCGLYFIIILLSQSKQKDQEQVIRQKRESALKTLSFKLEKMDMIMNENNST